MTDKTELWFIARKGSSLAYFKPEGLLQGIVEVHPDHPPIMHWLGGLDEELKCNDEGVPIIVWADPLAKIEFDIGSAAFTLKPTERDPRTLSSDTPQSFDELAETANLMRLVEARRRKGPGR